MTKTISELLAYSFKVEARLTDARKIVLPDAIIQVMGTELKGDFCRGKNNHHFLLVSKTEDAYFKGEPLVLRGKHLILPQIILDKLKLQSKDRVICSYNGVGEYFTIQKDFD